MFFYRVRKARLSILTLTFAALLGAGSTFYFLREQRQAVLQQNISETAALLAAQVHSDLDHLTRTIIEVAERKLRPLQTENLQSGKPPFEEVELDAELMDLSFWSRPQGVAKARKVFQAVNSQYVNSAQEVLLKSELTEAQEVEAISPAFNGQKVFALAGAIDPASVALIAFPLGSGGEEILVGHLRLAHFQRALNWNTSIRAALASLDGVVLATSNQAQSIQENLKNHPLFQGKKVVLSASGEGEISYQDSHGLRSLGAFHRLPNTQLVILTHLPETEAGMGLGALFNQGVLFMGGLYSLIFGMGYLLAGGYGRKMSPTHHQVQESPLDVAEDKTQETEVMPVQENAAFHAPFKEVESFEEPSIHPLPPSEPSVAVSPAPAVRSFPASGDVAWRIHNGVKEEGPYSARQIAARLYVQELDFEFECWFDGIDGRSTIGTSGMFVGTDEENADFWVYDREVMHGPMTRAYLKESLKTGEISPQWHVCEKTTVQGWMLLSQWAQSENRSKEGADKPVPVPVAPAIVAPGIVVPAAAEWPSATEFQAMTDTPLSTPEPTVSERHQQGVASQAVSSIQKEKSKDAELKSASEGSSEPFQLPPIELIVVKEGDGSTSHESEKNAETGDTDESVPPSGSGLSWRNSA